MRKPSDVLVSFLFKYTPVCGRQEFGGLEGIMYSYTVGFTKKL